MEETFEKGFKKGLNIIKLIRIREAQLGEAKELTEQKLSKMNGCLEVVFRRNGIRRLFTVQVLPFFLSIFFYFFTYALLYLFMLIFS